MQPSFGLEFVEIVVLLRAFLRYALLLFLLLHSGYSARFSEGKMKDICIRSVGNPLPLSLLRCEDRPKIPIAVDV